MLKKALTETVSACEWRRPPGLATGLEKWRRLASDPRPVEYVPSVVSEPMAAVQSWRHVYNYSQRTSADYYPNVAATQTQKMKRLTIVESSKHDTWELM